MNKYAYSKNKKCSECGKLITNVSERCKSCAKKGTLAPSFKHGKCSMIAYCIDCGKQLGQHAVFYGNLRCRPCADKIHSKQMIGKNNPMHGVHRFGEESPRFINGDSIAESFCVDCDKKLSIHAKYYGSIRCGSCGQKYNFIIHPELGENQALRMKGNNFGYINGESNFPYPLEFNDTLKESIRKRDTYICQKCGITEEEHVIVFGYSLHVHHIDYDKNNSDENNLISLCVSCHARTNVNRAHWQKFYQIKIKESVERE